MTDAELVELTAKWQDRLRLLHWDIEVGYLPACKMEGPYRQGECLYHPETRTAKIQLVDPQTADDDDWPWDTVERTLIHELLHLLFAEIWDDDNPNRKRDTESVIHVLSGALVELGEKAEERGALMQAWEGATTASDSLASRFSRLSKRATV
jgi:hypothetical protein